MSVRLVVCIMLILSCCGVVCAQEQRAITPSDCVSVRGLLHDDLSWHSTIKFSPTRSHVAYAVRVPYLTENSNEVEIYVRNLPLGVAASHTAKPILRGTAISSLQWRPDGRYLVYLVKRNGRMLIEQMDAITGNRSILFAANTDIAEFSIDGDGKTIAYAVDVPGQDSTYQPSPTESAGGYRISFQEGEQTIWPQRNIFVIHRVQGTWSKPKLLIIKSPLSGGSMAAITYLPNSGLGISLSPSGRYLAMEYLEPTQDLPDEWRNSAYRNIVDRSGQINAFYLVILCDLDKDTSTVPLKSPFVISAPVWAPNGKAFAVAGQAPIGSSLEEDAIANHTITHSAAAHLFSVEPSTGKVKVMASHLAYPWEGLLYWGNNDDVLVRLSSMDNLTRIVERDNSWEVTATYHVPLAGSSQLATDGSTLIGEHSDPGTPPELFEAALGSRETRVFAKLNPQFDHLTIAQTKEVRWKTSTGYGASGLLLLPPGYIEGDRYPLVIQTKPFFRGFACSFGDSPSFTPQAIANAGMMYLGAIDTPDVSQRQEDYFPHGYPGYQGLGGIAEAAFNMDLWDSAVASLDAQGLVDKNKVGIIGFSRTGWYVEFILANSKTRYQAATIADNVHYSLGEYWLRHDASTIKAWDALYAGPPYGDTLSNWLKYSISFNLDKIHTPILMEEMGNNQPVFTNRLSPPRLLAESFETFTGLSRLNRPVELYYYPFEDHSPTHPQARLATFQRNVDWYRFWLQGYERPNPEDPDQYKRWKHLRELRDADDKAAHQPHSTP